MKLRLLILSLAVTVMLIGCGGLSTSSRDTGTGASTHTVALSWAASTSADVSGYNVYRAVYTNSCGSFSKINSVLIASTSYRDSEVTNGTSYCYAASAVDTSNEESGYSNIVWNVQIPAS
jgi:fibronectin type 3 domain-containing protein